MTRTRSSRPSRCAGLLGRFAIAPGVQVEVLDRLLELNHERYAEEIRQGLHAKKKPKAKRPETLLSVPHWMGLSSPKAPCSHPLLANGQGNVMTTHMAG